MLSMLSRASWRGSRLPWQQGLLPTLAMYTDTYHQSVPGSIQPSPRGVFDEVLEEKLVFSDALHRLQQVSRQWQLVAQRCLDLLGGEGACHSFLCFTPPSPPTYLEEHLLHLTHFLQQLFRVGAVLAVFLIQLKPFTLQAK